jgi:hypothetical protein
MQPLQVGDPVRWDAKVMRGGKDAVVLAGYVVASVEPKEHGKQERWRQSLATAKTTDPSLEGLTVGACGAARFFECFQHGGSLFMLRHLLVHFLEDHKENKGSLGNMDTNVLNALQDTPTLMEIVVNYICFAEFAYGCLTLKTTVNNMWHVAAVFDRVEAAIQAVVGARAILPRLVGVDRYVDVLRHALHIPV